MNIENMTKSQQYPLTTNQQGLYFIQQQHRDCFAYNIPLCFELSTPQLDIDNLRQACQLFVTQHPILTATVQIVNDQPMQLTHPAAAIDFVVDDKIIDKNKLKSELETQVNTPFDLTNGPICRFRLFRTSTQTTIFVMVVHHIVFDGLSSLMTEQIFSNYQKYTTNDPITAVPLASSYFEYQQCQQDWLNGTEAHQQLNFWQQQLAELPELALPLDKQRPTRRDFNGHCVTFTFDPTTVKQLQAQLKEQKNVTLSTVCLAAYQILLSRYASQQDLTIGVPVSTRTLPGSQNTVGYFVNMLPIRTQLNDSMAVNEFLQQLSQQVWTCYSPEGDCDVLRL
jgi:NRPS condensation-like uncharacterized protein